MVSAEVIEVAEGVAEEEALVVVAAEVASIEDLHKVLSQ